MEQNKDVAPASPAALTDGQIDDLWRKHYYVSADTDAVRCIRAFARAAVLAAQPAEAARASRQVGPTRDDNAIIAKHFADDPANAVRAHAALTECLSARHGVALSAVDAIMTKIQEFASTWAVVGGRFDDGSAMERAEECKAEIRAILSRASSSRAEVEIPEGWKIASDEEGWSIVSPSGDGCFLFDNDRLHGQTMEGAAIREVFRQLCSSLVFPLAAAEAPNEEEP